jgi:IPT/TIG domain
MADEPAQTNITDEGAYRGATVTTLVSTHDRGSLEFNQRVGQGDPFGPEPAVPDPHITSLNPNTASAAAGAVTVTVTGTDFVSGSVIEIDHAAAPTTYVSATSLTTSYDPSTVGAKQFTVRNPNEEESNSVAFTVTA